jgi:hypothetical protein
VKAICHSWLIGDLSIDGRALMGVGVGGDRAKLQCTDCVGGPQSVSSSAAIVAVVAVVDVVAVCVCVKQDCWQEITDLACVQCCAAVATLQARCINRLGVGHLGGVMIRLQTRYM